MGKPTSDALRQEILKRTRAGELQKHIARALRLSKDTVGKIQREHGLQPYPGFTLTAKKEKQVIALFKAGFGQPYITKTSHVPGHIVYEIRDRHGLRRAPGTAYARYNFAAPQLRAIRRAIRTAERRIAHEFGVTHSWLRQFRRTMWSNSGEHSRRKLIEPQETMSAEKFVATYFQFAARPGVTITGADVKTAAEMLLKLRTEFCGKPQNESEYYRGLCDAVAAHLGVAATESGWVH